jgi:hypothetical protein
MTALSYRRFPRVGKPPETSWYRCAPGEFLVIPGLGLGGRIGRQSPHGLARCQA